MVEATSATRITVSTFGALAGLAGIEHGVGEVLQGNVAPAGVVIRSWPESQPFRILAGEPAMTIVPSLLITGLLAIVSSLAFLVWATVFVERKHGARALIVLSIVMLLLGAGFGPPLLGMIVGVTATRIGAPSTWWRALLSAGSGRLLARLWPWSFGASLIVWLLLFPGTVIVAYLLGLTETSPSASIAVAALPPTAFGSLALTIIAAFARDVERQSHRTRTARTSGQRRTIDIVPVEPDPLALTPAKLSVGAVRIGASSARRATQPDAFGRLVEPADQTGNRPREMPLASV